MKDIGTPIPWHFTDMPGVLQWTWLTPHFVATIRGEEFSGDGVEEGKRHVRFYRWEVGDMIVPQQGTPRLLIEGSATTFEEADEHIREHVGKAYDPSLGYRAYAGSLAYTFTLATGERVDVREFVGTHCSLRVLTADRGEQLVAGDFDVRNYEFCLTTATDVMCVVPEHVLKITNRSEAAEKAAKVTRLDSYVGIGRIYAEEKRPGCTGRPGYHPGTVDHAGAPRCPLHEEGLPEHLLH